MESDYESKDIEEDLETPQEKEKKGIKFYALFILKNIFYNPPNKLNTYQVKKKEIVFKISLIFYYFFYPKDTCLGSCIGVKSF